MAIKQLTFRLNYLCLFIFSFFTTTSLLSEEVSSQQRCLIEQMEQLSEETTIGEIKRLCEKKLQAKESNKTSSLTQSKPTQSGIERLAFTPHKANYLLPISYNDSHN